MCVSSCYIYDKNSKKWKRVPSPIVKKKPEQTQQMKQFLQQLREKYKDRDFEKEIEENSKKELKPVKF